MTVNFEVKGMLAKLLATENLVVEHKPVQTACFNVHTRVLTLPMWKKASNLVYDMLVAHETAHALHTPDEDWSEQVKVPPQFVNVVEDARVEKLIKRRYPGLPKTFYGAYKELNDDDFFMIGDEDVSKMNLADRANLYFKIGAFIPLSFNEKEQEIIDMIGDAETFGDVLLASEVLYRYCKEEQFQKAEIPEINLHPNQGGQSGSGEDGEKVEGQIDSEESEDSNGDNASNESSTEGKRESEGLQNGMEGGVGADPEVSTMNSLNDSIKNLVENSYNETVYLEIPKVNLESVIVPNSDIHNHCDEIWNDSFQKELLQPVDKEYIEFKRSAQREVNYLVKEFECRKSADSYARSHTSRTGVLDTSKLHTYRYNEDLFKKVTTLADGKNHGLVFILDWSGSMGNVLLDTMKQLYNLIWFCKKVSIPFEVYAFTDSFGPQIKTTKSGMHLPPSEHTVKKENEFAIHEYFRLMNIFTSKVRNSELENQMKNFFRIARYFSKNSHQTYSIPSRLHLSGTPLNESLVALYEILPKFKRENKLQKVHCVVLTDGEGAPLHYHRSIKRAWQNEPYLGTAYVDEKCFLRDRKTGNVYKMGDCSYRGYMQFTDLILKNLRDRFPSMNFVGMRLLESGQASSFIRRYADGKEGIDVTARWKKEKSFVLTSSGYHKYFGISGNALNKSTEFEVDEDASKSKIKTAFTKSLGAKKMNKKILSEFISLVA